MQNHVCLQKSDHKTYKTNVLENIRKKSKHSQSRAKEAVTTKQWQALIESHFETKTNIRKIILDQSW